MDFKKGKIDYSDIPETDEEFWKNATVMIPVHLMFSEENYNFLSKINKPFEIALNDILDTYRINKNDLK